MVYKLHNFSDYNSLEKLKADLKQYNIEIIADYFNYNNISQQGSYIYSISTPGVTNIHETTILTNKNYNKAINLFNSNFKWKKNENKIGVFKKTFNRSGICKLIYGSGNINNITGKKIRELTKVKLYLNNEKIDETDEIQKEMIFKFKTDDILEIKEEISVINLYAMELNYDSTKFKNISGDVIQHEDINSLTQCTIYNLSNEENNDKVYSIEIGEFAELKNPSEADFSIFFKFKNLNNITVASSNKWLISENNVLYNKDKIILVCVPKNITSFIIPNTINEIYHEAFENCEKLTSLIIPNNIEKIGNYAFYNTPLLTTIYINPQAKLIQNGTLKYGTVSNFYGLKSVLIKTII